MTTKKKKWSRLSILLPEKELKAAERGAERQNQALSSLIRFMLSRIADPDWKMHPHILSRPRIKIDEDGCPLIVTPPDWSWETSGLVSSKLLESIEHKTYPKIRDALTGRELKLLLEELMFSAAIQAYMRGEISESSDGVWEPWCGCDREMESSWSYCPICGLHVGSIDKPSTFITRAKRALKYASSSKKPSVKLRFLADAIDLLNRVR